MTENDQKKAIGRAYVKAVAAPAGFATYQPSVDDDSIDLGIAASGTSGFAKRPRVEMQLKCTASDPPEEPTFSFPLKRKNYDDLRPSAVAIPRILVVMLVPDNLADWLNHTERELAIRRCTYWMSLREMPETTNEKSVTVAIPRTNVFSVDGLRGIMSRIDQGSFP
jgi:uncharacterized protein DUF4365